MSFWKENKIEEDKKEITKSTIPFLEREGSITDLKSLMLRVTNLITQIRKSTELISDLKYQIEKLENGISYVRMDDNCRRDIPISPSDYPEVVETFRLSLIESCKCKIEKERDMIHTCQDELDWLEMKVGMGPNLGKNMFETRSFDFDPTKDHC